MTIKPLGDRIVVTVEEVDTDAPNEFGLILPKSQQGKSDHQEGTVIAVGPGMFEEYRDVDGTPYPMYRPMALKEGDKVVFTFGEEFTFEKKKYYILRETDIFATIEA